MNSYCLWAKLEFEVLVICNTSKNATTPQLVFFDGFQTCIMHLCLTGVITLTRHDSCVQPEPVTFVMKHNAGSCVTDVVHTDISLPPAKIWIMLPFPEPNIPMKRLTVFPSLSSNVMWSPFNAWNLSPNAMLHQILSVLDEKERWKIKWIDKRMLLVEMYFMCKQSQALLKTTYISACNWSFDLFMKTMIFIGCDWMPLTLNNIAFIHKVRNVFDVVFRFWYSKTNFLCFSLSASSV